MASAASVAARPATDIRLVPARLRSLEPLACLALAGHALAVQVVAEHRLAPLITGAAAVLALLGLAGLLGARGTTAVAIRAGGVLVLGLVLQAASAETSGFFVLWFFVLVSVYPLALPDPLAGLVPALTPAAYLTLLPMDAVDGSTAIALLRAVSLALIGVFVHRAAVAYRGVAAAHQASEAAARQSLATMQHALLPHDVASLDGVTVAARYRAAGMHDRIGGDWYDTIVLPVGGLALVIGDVEGHDLTAASVMGLVRGAVRSYALEGHPPSIVLQRVNAFILSAGIQRLVTMAYVQLYPGDTIATVALAGHPAPLVLRAGDSSGNGTGDGTGDGTGTARFLEVDHGPLLGVGDLAGWSERTVRLPADASLVLYTDGLLPRPAATGDNLEQLRSLAAELTQGPPDLVADTLISQAPRLDDAAVLVARVTTSGRPSAVRSFPAQPITASVARTWLADLFGLWQATAPGGSAGSDHRDTALLLLTELVSNAVRHSEDTVRVRLDLQEDRLRVEVHDTSERMPVMRRPEAAATEGRGLRLVDALSSAWGVRLEARGKSVWFELCLTGPAAGDELDDAALLAAYGDGEDVLDDLDGLDVPGRRMP